jgi:methylmalonyl-CoA/ethylmalonyl-CoA epimerase
VSDSKIVQLGFVVTDLHATAMQWTNAWGVGPWFYREHLRNGSYRFRGVPSSPDVSTAMADWNGLQIQLVQQHNDAPSPHTEWLERHGGAPGLNHIAVAVPDFRSAVERRVAAGDEPVVEAGDPVSNVFFQSHRDLPAVEISERGGPASMVERLYAVVAAAARDWDGTDPWRPMPPLT